MPSASAPADRLRAGLAALNAVHTAAREVSDQLAAERAVAAPVAPSGVPTAPEAPHA